MATLNSLFYIADPLKVGRMLWPNVTFYDMQREVIYSAFENDETYVPAGNMLGKDFVLAFIVLVFFLTRQPCRILTTSVDVTQLESVLWGEIRNFIQTCKYPLSHEQGGPLLINHLHIRRVFTAGKLKGKTCPKSYLLGRVAAKGEGFLGHHIAKTGDGIPRTMLAGDEASGMEDIVYDRADTWTDRKIFIGNCYPSAPGCSFFEKHIEKGDIEAKDHSEDVGHGTRSTG